MRLSTFAVLLPLALAACGGGSADPVALRDAGYEALGSGSWSAARSEFQAGLEAIGNDATNPEFANLSLGAIEAQIQIDAGAARDELLQLSKDHGALLKDRDYSSVAGKLAGAGKLSEAIDVMDAGIKAHPDSESLQKVQKSIVAKAKAAGDKGAMDALAGLGYLGE